LKDEKVQEKFEQYRKYLNEEAKRLARYVRVFRLLHERRADRLDEMNIAPAFFSIVTDALFCAIVLWIDKLLAKDSERGIWNLLTFVEHHLPIFSVEALKRRRDLPDGHFLLNRPEIDLSTIEQDRSMIDGFAALEDVKLRRDKFQAHFDKKYFFDRERIANEAPLNWSDLDRALEIIGDVLNRYSAAYDGEVSHLEPLNAGDLNYLLDRLHSR
jgi:hypothetical protein